MKEVFYEETAFVQDQSGSLFKYNIFKVLVITCYALAAVSGILALMFPIVETMVLLSIIIACLPVGIFIVLAIFLSRLRDKMYVDYDYTFVSGSINVSKVINNIKRKNVFSFEAKHIERIGYYNSDTYKLYQSMPEVEEIKLTSNQVPAEGKDFYYIVASFNAEKHLMVFECTKTFITTILGFTNRIVLERSF